MRTIIVGVCTAVMFVGVAACAQATPSYPVLGPRGHVHANGRCHGTSYGTGSHSCGTATGGPSGGLPSRN